MLRKSRFWISDFYENLKVKDLVDFSFILTFAAKIDGTESDRSQADNRRRLFPTWRSQNNLFVSSKVWNMKKSLFLFVSLAFLFILAASSSGLQETDTQIGSQAPNFTITNQDTVLSLQQARGKYVVLTFWSSIDPNSRIQNMLQDRSTSQDSRVEHIGVNYDRSKKVFNEICHLDHLGIGLQFYGNTPEGQRLLELWHQEKGYTSFLIDPQGKIVAVNPTQQMLQSI